MPASGTGEFGKPPNAEDPAEPSVCVRLFPGRYTVHAVALAVLVVFLAAFFWQLTVQRRVLSPADLIFTVYPWSSQAPPGFQSPSNPLQSDDAFIYHPRRHSLYSDDGTGFSWWQDDYLAGSRNTFSNDFLGLEFYPPAWAYYVLPFHIANGVFHVSILLVAGVAMYLLLCELRAPPPAAVYGALLFMLNGHFIVWLGAWPLPAILGLIPLMIFGFERHRRLRQPLYLLIPAACLAMQIYIAYVPGWVVTGGVLVIYGLIRLALSIWRREYGGALRQAGAYVVASVLGLLLATYSLLPSVSSALASDYQADRQSGLGKVPWKDAVTYLFPDYWGSPEIPAWIGPGGNYPEWIAYFGVSTVPLVLIGMWRLQRGWAVWFALGILVFALSQVYGLEPLKSLAHVPGLRQTAAARWHYGVPLATSILAALGMYSLLEGDIPPRSRRFLAATVAAAMMLGIVFVVWLRLFRGDGDSWRLITEGRGLVPRPGDFVGELEDFSTHLHRQMVFLLGSGALAIFALLARPVWTRRAVLALVLLAFLDLFAFGSTYGGTVEKADLYPPTQGLEYLQSDRDLFRIAAAGGILPGYTANVYGLDIISGYDHYHDREYLAFLAPMLSKANVQFVDTFGYLYIDHPEAGRNLLALLNVKYVVFPPGSRPTDQWLTTAYSGKDLAIYRLDAALPRVWGAGRAEVLPSRQDALDRVASDGFDPATTAVFASEDLPPGFSTPGGAAGGSFYARMTRYKSDGMTVRTDFSEAGFLILSERYDDGWRATVDGESARVLRADGILRAVPVSAGAHTVELYFRPWEYVWGARVSLATAFLTVASVAIYLIRPMWQRPRSRLAGASRTLNDQIGVTRGW